MGIHNFIKTKYFPCEDAKEILIKNNRGKRHNHRYKRDVLKKNNKLQHERTPLGGPSEGFIGGNCCISMNPKEHGSRVDRELQTYANIKNIKSRDVFINDNILAIDPCTIKVVQWLKKRNLMLRECQRIIYNEEAELATAIDMICTDERTGEMVIIELKTSGHSSAEWYETALKGRMKNNFICTSFGYFPLSMMWIDQIQLYLMVSMLRDKYKIPIENRNAFVLRVCADRICRYNLKII